MSHRTSGSLFCIISCISKICAFPAEETIRAIVDYPVGDIYSKEIEFSCIPDHKMAMTAVGDISETEIAEIVCYFNAFFRFFLLIFVYFFFKANVFFLCIVKCHENDVKYNWL